MLVKKFLMDIYGPQTKISNDLLTKDVFLNSYEIGNREPYFFTYYLAKEDAWKYDFKAHDMLRATFDYPGVIMK